MITIDKERKEIPNPYPLKELLIETTLSSSRAIPTDLASIDLGEFGKVAEAILERTLHDTTRLERGRYVLITRKGTILMQNSDVIGKITANGQEIPMKLKITRHLNPFSVPRIQRQDKFIATFIHSHGEYNNPMSPADLTPLFYSEFEPGAWSSVFVITPQLKMLAFRGEKTPQWEKKNADKRGEYWTQLFIERVDRFLDINHSPEEVNIINCKAGHALLRSIAKTYDLRLFSCPSLKNIAYLEYT